MIELTAKRWTVGPLTCTVERNGLRAPKRARYAWRVMLPEGDVDAWPPGDKLIAYGTTPDADGAWQDAQNAAQDWLQTQPKGTTDGNTTQP